MKWYALISLRGNAGLWNLIEISARLSWFSQDVESARNRFNAGALLSTFCMVQSDVLASRQGMS